MFLFEKNKLEYQEDLKLSKISAKGQYCLIFSAISLIIVIWETMFSVLSFKYTPTLADITTISEPVSLRIIRRYTDIENLDVAGIAFEISKDSPIALSSFQG